ncbi:FmdE family protein [Desulfobacter curvatus]|uniref:FmdE family protein n=1 Tax=Desulfobacter curvatus TaxID=2290 RepID=UPI000370415E|nr:FmdE family protein [Desulfobacter curvatus]
MKRSFVIFCTALIFVFTAAQGFAAMPSITPVIEKAMTTLQVIQADRNFLVLTNATAVMTDGKSSLPILEQVQEATGAIVGKGNLLFFQRAQDAPLRIMLFKKSDRSAVIISADNSKWAVDTLDFAPKTVSDPNFWKDAKDKYAAGKDLFTLATLANAWAEGAPYDFLKSAELHNHICPGLTSGYLMAHFILDHYPLGKGQKYTIISSPVWCKEDAFQVVMDQTPGKRGLVVKPLSEEQKEKISIPNPAGMVLIWDQKLKKGKGVALSFDFNTLKGLYPKETPKAASILYTASYLSSPDKFVSVAKEFDLDETMFNAIREAGGNPWEPAGLTTP